ncbi:MAG: hypothetical protein KIT16_10325 [Rhodospirillaceae bacterium]|nr:hypothetical protein [Rhodospirillaceae bacterium]
MKGLIVAWQDPIDRRWHPIGRLTYDDTRKVFRFVYTKGVLASGSFIPFGKMTDIRAVHESEKLFPLFANRLMPESRPEYDSFVKWLGLDRKVADPLSLLGRSGGAKATDSIVVFPIPEKSADGMYRTVFWCHGISHAPSASVERVNALKEGEKLFPAFDVLNIHDREAILLRTDDPLTAVGYCPRYLNTDFGRLIRNCDSDSISIRVERVNWEAPLQFRLLCSFTSCWPKDYVPFDGEAFEPMSTLSVLGEHESLMR